MELIESGVKIYLNDSEKNNLVHFCQLYFRDWRSIERGNETKSDIKDMERTIEDFEALLQNL